MGNNHRSSFSSNNSLNFDGHIIIPSELDFQQSNDTTLTQHNQSEVISILIINYGKLN